MAELFTSSHEIRSNPLDLIQAFAEGMEWPHDRFGEDELAVGVSGRWCEFHMCFAMREAPEILHFTCTFDTKVPPQRRDDALIMLALANEKMWLGHFELDSETGLPFFRHALPTRGGAGVTSGQMEDLIEIALNEMERFYPAIQLLLWGGKAPREALELALLETVGEA